MLAEYFYYQFKNLIMRSIMNSRQINSALELARTLNFNQAAENLFISQPTLSYHIKTLEEEVGIKLFERSGKGAVLTPGGKQFIHDLRQINHDLSMAIERAQNLGRQYQSSIRLGVFGLSALPHLPEAILEFNQQYPEIFVDVVFESGNDQLDQLLTGQLDLSFAVTSSLPKGGDLQTIPLYDSPINLLVNQQDPLANLGKVELAQLANRTLIVGSVSPKELKHLQNQVVTNYQVQTINSPNHATTITHVLTKRGICLTPAFLKDATPGLTWLPLAEEVLIPCSMVMRRGEIPAPLRTLIDILIQVHQGAGQRSD